MIAEKYVERYNSLKYPEDYASLNREAKILASRVYNEAVARIEAAFKAELEAYHGIEGHSKADKLYHLAYEYGHSSGFQEIEYYYNDLVELILD